MREIFYEGRDAVLTHSTPVVSRDHYPMRPQGLCDVGDILSVTVFI